MAEQAQTLSGDNKWLADVLVVSLGQSIQGMTGEQPAFESTPCWPAQESTDEPVSWRAHGLRGLNAGTLWVGVPETTWRIIGGQALKAAGIDDAAVEDFRATWDEIVAQAVSSSAQAIAKRVRREVGCEPPLEASVPKQPAAGVLLRWPSGGTPVWAHLLWNAAVVESLGLEADAPAVESGQSMTPAKASSSSAVEHSRTLELLLEVQLPVSVSFGRTQLPLKDVLKLNSGSIVELNRGISEPVEVIINNCVIARGEVVVVEGNYGVRISQIISKEERLRTLY